MNIKRINIAWQYCGVWTGIVLVSMLGMSALGAKDTKVDKQYIAKRVEQAIENKFKNAIEEAKAKPDLRQVHKNRGYDPSGGAIYLLPNWPFYSLYFHDNDLITADISFNTASQAYSGHGGSENLSKLIFGEPPITIKEILLASRLSNEALMVIPGMTPVETQQYYYLSILAPQQVNFNATLNVGQVALSYARHFHDGDVTVGFYLPVKVRGQRLHITNDLTPEMRKKLEDIASGKDPVTGLPCIVDGVSTKDKPELHFFDYYDGLQDFVTTIINQKGMAFSQKETVGGLGDMMAYLNIDIPSHHFARVVTGLSVLIPTARERDMGKLWDEELGNGGFVEGSWYGSALWEVNRWFNPYIHTTATYRFASNVYRRVPRYNAYDPTSGMFNDIKVGVPDAPAKSVMVLGESLFFRESFTQKPDASVRNFADQSRKVKITPGAELFVRAGDTFDAVFSNHGFFDIYYDLHLKGKDYIRHNPVDSPYITQILGHNTYMVSHTLGANYSYQFDEALRLRLGLWYVVAGRNTPKTFGVDLGLNAEF